MLHGWTGGRLCSMDELVVDCAPWMTWVVDCAPWMDWVVDCAAWMNWW